jgi:hypothetical protein
MKFDHVFRILRYRFGKTEGLVSMGLMIKKQRAEKRE